MIDSNSIDDYSISILLRHLMGTTQIRPNVPHVARGRDIEFLYFHWAISKPIKNLASYLVENRHETQTILDYRSCVNDAVSRGRIDARATIVQRLKSGLPTAVVSAEPTRTYSNGPNQLLAWVVNQSSQIAFKFTSLHSLGLDYRSNISSTLHLLDQVRRLEFFRSIVSEISTTRRPQPASLITAKQSRRKLYRLAYEAYQTFIAIERGDQRIIADVLKETLLAPLENWRRLELAVALGIGEALAENLHRPLELAIIGTHSRAPILRCGSYAIYWQTLTNYYTLPPHEDSERIVSAILSAYNMNASGDRPDLLVTNEDTNEVISIIEVKFHAGDQPNARFREAIYQIVRYCRGYQTKPMELLERSAVAMNTTVPIVSTPGSGIPFAFSFNDILQDRLAIWIAAKWLS